MAQWGWPAQNSLGQQVSLFKLYLSGKDTSNLPRLPDFAQNDVTIVIADYLRNLVAFIIQTIKEQLLMEVLVSEIQWCLTVPAMWKDPAKAAMKRAAQIAGMVQGKYGTPGVGSMHELQVGSIYLIVALFS